MALVQVYRNLTAGCLSVRRGGIVVARPQYAALEDPEFVVQEGGRQRVLRENRKNVHAFVEGYRTRVPNHKPAGLVWVVYDPFKYASFVVRDTGRPIYEARLAIVVLNGVWAVR